MEAKLGSWRHQHSNDSDNHSKFWNYADRRDILLRTIFDTIARLNLSSLLALPPPSFSPLLRPPPPSSRPLTHSPLQQHPWQYLTLSTSSTSAAAASTSSTPTPTSSIYDLNREEVQTMLPTIAMLSVLMTLGVVGNVCVVYVYGCKMRKTSTYRLFILTLAVYDLTACIVGVPGVVVELEKPYTFHSGMGCKLLRFGYHVLACGSSVTHVLIGIDRYRRICKPTRQQMSVQNARVASLTMFIVVLFVSFPKLILTDSVTVPTRVQGVFGRGCGIPERYADSPYPLVFNIVLSLFIVITAVVLIVLYALIGHTIYRRCDVFESMTSSASGVNTDATGRITHRSKVGAPIFRNKVNPVSSHASPQCTKQDSSDIKAPPCSRENSANVKSDGGMSVSIVTSAFNRASTSVWQQPRLPDTRACSVKHSRLILSRKMTVTTFAVMVVYVVSYVPVMVLALINVVDRNVKDGMTFTEEALYYLGYHTYVLNNVANPLVYMFMDVEFRKNCIQLFSVLKQK